MDREQTTVGTSDLELLNQIRERSSVAMEIFYKRHAAPVHAFANRRLGDLALADEVVNDTLHQVWLSANSFAGKSSVKTWLLGIAKNKTLDALRSKAKLQSREVEVSDEEQSLRDEWIDTSPDAYAHVLGKQQAKHLQTCFDQLPIEQRSCLHLSFVDGLTLTEIAEVMAIPANTAATRIHHAKRKLRDCITCLSEPGAVL